MLGLMFILAPAGSDVYAAYMVVNQCSDWPHACRMKRWRQCYNDEHYLPSLLSREGLDHETDCHGGIMSCDWTTRDWHPVTYRAANISTQLCVSALP